MHLIQYLTEYTIYYLILSVIISSVVWSFSKNTDFSNLNKNLNSLVFIKYVLLISLFVSSITVFILTALYCFQQNELNRYVLFSLLYENMYYIDTSKVIIFDNFFLHFNLDGFGLVVLNLAIMVGFISLLSLDTRFY